MPSKSLPTKKDDMQNAKAAAFEWIAKALIGISCFVVIETRTDIKELAKQFVQIRIDVDLLQDRQLNMRFRMIPPAKHEEVATLDSLISN